MSKKKTYQCPARDQIKQLFTQINPVDKKTEIKQFVQLIRTDEDLNKDVVNLLESLLNTIEKQETDKSAFSYNLKVFIKIILGIIIFIIFMFIIALITLKPPLSITLIALSIWLIIFLFAFIFFFTQVKYLSKSDAYNMLMFILTIFSLVITLSQL